jgi:hypothetical protein
MIKSFQKYLTTIMIRVSVGALVSSLALLGATKYIIDKSLEGVKQTLEVMNSRITDLNANFSDTKSDISSFFDLRFQLNESRMETEFKRTRRVIDEKSEDMYATFDDVLGHGYFYMPGIGSKNNILIATNPSRPNIDNIISAILSDNTFSRTYKSFQFVGYDFLNGDYIVNLDFPNYTLVAKLKDEKKISDFVTGRANDILDKQIGLIAESAMYKKSLSELAISHDLDQSDCFDVVKKEIETWVNPSKLSDMALSSNGIICFKREF